MMQGQDVLTCPNSANNNQKTSICEVFLLDRRRKKSYQFRSSSELYRGYGSAVSLPRLIVGTRHCRVLISGYINSDATGSDIKTIFVATKNILNVLTVAI